MKPGSISAGTPQPTSSTTVQTGYYRVKYSDAETSAARRPGAAEGPAAEGPLGVQNDFYA